MIMAELVYLYCHRCDMIEMSSTLAGCGGYEEHLCEECADLSRLDDDGCPGASQYPRRRSYDEIMGFDRKERIFCDGTVEVVG